MPTFKGTIIKDTIGSVLSVAILATVTGFSASNYAAAQAVDDVSPFKFHDLETDRDRENTFAGQRLSPETFKVMEFRAKEGDEIAMWKLGRHFSADKGGKQNHLRAFEMFSKVVRSQREHTPYSQKAPFTAHALVALGFYYRGGIPNSYVTKDSERAWSMFVTAATYYGDPKAQFSLFDMCDKELADQCSKVQAGRWLKRSAVNGDIKAQAQLGYRQFEGSHGVRRDKIRGLTWLTIARERAHVARHMDVFDLHERAFSLATAEERQVARTNAEQWMQSNCGNVLTC